MILKRRSIESIKKCFTENACDECDNTRNCVDVNDLMETLENAWEELDRYKKEAIKPECYGEHTENTCQCKFDVECRKLTAELKEVAND